MKAYHVWALGVQSAILQLDAGELELIRAALEIVNPDSERAIRRRDAMLAEVKRLQARDERPARRVRA
jgi:hypothetical protein